MRKKKRTNRMQLGGNIEKKGSKILFSVNIKATVLKDTQKKSAAAEEKIIP